ncbi:MAG: cell envelope integrity protein CreD [Calditrichia bacterium]
MNKNGLKNSVSVRMFIIGMLVVVMMIPAFMVQELIRERKMRWQNVFQEVSDKWGEKQIISGPVLSVPYDVPIRLDNGQVEMQEKYAHLLPQHLNIQATVNPEIRYRGIYELVLYKADIRISGDFLPSEIQNANVPDKDLRWQDAIISVGISDMKGIQQLINITWNGGEIEARPGIPVNDVLSSGIYVNTDIKNSNEKATFSFNLHVNGSEDLWFTPLGVETNAEISSDWGTPSFNGMFLPDERIVSSEGFKASWNILHLNRNFPQYWTGNAYRINQAAFGVKLLIPVESYQKTMRTAKYAFMFVALTFLAFFMIEVINRRRIHPIQYLLIGFALILFYTLLLSISEYLSFGVSYLIACVAIVAMISLYTMSILKQMKHTMIILIELILLYSYLYIVLQLEDYALLMGSIGLFVILAVVMYVTRKIDWYGLSEAEIKNVKE